MEDSGENRVDACLAGTYNEGIGFQVILPGRPPILKHKGDVDHANVLKMQAREFKKMRDPNDRKGGNVKYVCYIQASSIPPELRDWMKTNPRDQKMTTSVATAICNSLEENSNFSCAESRNCHVGGGGDL